MISSTTGTGCNLNNVKQEARRETTSLLLRSPAQRYTNKGKKEEEETRAQSTEGDYVGKRSFAQALQTQRGAPSGTGGGPAALGPGQAPSAAGGTEPQI